MDWNYMIMSVRNENVVNDLMKVPQWAKAEKLENVIALSEIWKRDDNSSHNCRSIVDKRIRMEMALGERSVEHLGDKIRVGLAESLYRLADVISPTRCISE